MKRFSLLTCTAIFIIFTCIHPGFAQENETYKEKVNRTTLELKEQFLNLSLQERVELWVKFGGFDTVFTYEGRTIENELILRGMDSVPYLAKIVRRGKGYESLGALRVLCEMDRFVPTEQLPKGVPSQPFFAENEPVGISDELMIVDGRRIGKEGIETILWAANQTKKKDLRFHAREYSGLLEQDMQSLSLEGQLEQWRKSARKCKGYPGMNDDCKLNQILGKTLKKKVPEIIPILSNIVESDTNPYVREQAIYLLVLIDRHSVRLRETEHGKKAIKTIEQALKKCKHKSILNDRESCDFYWNNVIPQFYKDENAMYGYWYLILDSLYGLGLKDKQFQKLSAEGERFVTYLTNVDPYFPSWEINCQGWGCAMDPRFIKKWERYYEHWKRFKTAEQSPSTSDGI